MFLSYHTSMKNWIILNDYQTKSFFVYRIDQWHRGSCKKTSALSCWLSVKEHWGSHCQPDRESWEVCWLPRAEVLLRECHYLSRSQTTLSCSSFMWAWNDHSWMTLQTGTSAKSRTTTKPWECKHEVLVPKLCFLSFYWLGKRALPEIDV